MSIHVGKGYLTQGIRIFCQSVEAVPSHLAKISVLRVRYPYPTWINELMDLFSPILKQFIWVTFRVILVAYMGKIPTLHGQKWENQCVLHSFNTGRHCTNILGLIVNTHLPGLEPRQNPEEMISPYCLRPEGWNIPKGIWRRSRPDKRVLSLFLHGSSQK